MGVWLKLSGCRIVQDQAQVVDVSAGTPQRADFLRYLADRHGTVPFTAEQRPYQTSPIASKRGPDVCRAITDDSGILYDRAVG
jgi:hypothetical protein